MSGTSFDVDVRHRCRGIGREAFAQHDQVGQPAGIEVGVDGLGEFGLAGPLMRQRQQLDHDPAGPLVANVRRSSASKAVR